METTRYLITLVHGTFAEEPKERQWTLEDSEFRATLAKHLSANVEFDDFQWDGRNRHSSRVQAGQRLANQLINKNQKSEGDRRILIGHSHGGNVVMYAVKALVRKSKDDIVDGIVCLATPHITVSERSLHGSFIAIGILIGFVLSAIYAIGITVPAFNAGFEIGGLIGVLFMVGFFIVFGLPIWLFAEPLHDKIATAAETKAKELATPELDKMPILSVKVRRDEAYLLLFTQQFLAAFARPFWRHGIAIAGRLFLAVIVALAAIAFLLVLYNMIPFVPDIELGFLTNSFGEIFGRFFAIVLFVLAIILVLVLVSPVLIRSHRWGFGREDLVTRSCLSVGVSERPQGCTLCDQETFLLSTIKAELKNRSLRHGIVYRSPTILKYVANWIERECNSL